MITVNHTEEIVPGTDLLDVEGIMRGPGGESKITLGQLPGGQGTDTYLRLVFYIGGDLRRKSVE